MGNRVRMDEIDQLFERSITPEGAMPLGFYAIVSWIDPDTGSVKVTDYNVSDLPLGELVGFIEWMKVRMLVANTSVE